MNKTLAASILALVIASPVLAESPTPWPRYPHQGIESQAHANGPAYAAPSAAYNVWTDAFVPFGSSAAATSADKGGQSPTPQAELDAQVRQYRAYWLARNSSLITPGGELAPALPVRVHERLNAKAFGSPVMSGAQ